MTEASDNMWFLSNYKDVTETVISKDIIKIDLPFNASYREISVDIFTKDCLTPFNDTTYPFLKWRSPPQFLQIMMDLCSSTQPWK